MHISKKSLFALVPLLIVLLTACSPSLLTKGNTSRVPLRENTTVSHHPTGTAILSWNPNNNMLVVTLHLTGLAPGSSHPAHIHQNPSCKESGPVLFPLHPVVANAAGVGISITSIENTHGIPSTGWSINIHNGPHLTSPGQSLSIACITIHNHSHIHGLLVLHYIFSPTAGDN